MKIEKVAEKFNLPKSDLTFYGNYMAKVENKNGKKHGKLVLVTAMTSNKYGVGKTTMSIGLGDAMNLLGHKTILALREPSMGPVFGVKGGATGGGKSSLFPSDEINLHRPTIFLLQLLTITFILETNLKSTQTKFISSAVLTSMTEV